MLNVDSIWSISFTVECFALYFGIFVFQIFSAVQLIHLKGFPISLIPIAFAVDATKSLPQWPILL